MSKLLKKGATRKAGLPPGSMVHIGNHISEAVKLSIIQYSKDNFTRTSVATLEECLEVNLEQMTWINISGIHDSQVISKIGQRFGLHPLILEDIVNSGQRSKLDFYPDCMYFVLRILDIIPENGIEDQQISLILKNNLVLSFLEKEESFFEIIYISLQEKAGRLREHGADYLCYSLLDILVDRYFIVLEKVDERVEKLDKMLTAAFSADTLRRIQQIKREITYLRKSIWPLREVVNNFLRSNSPLVQDSSRVFIQDLYDHTLKVIETIEGFRDLTSGMIEIHISTINQRLNEIMKVLTVVSTIFVPLTFIASIYGMNFHFMPELDFRWGYPFVLLLMMTIAIGMVTFFRRKHWI